MRVIQNTLVRRTPESRVLHIVIDDLEVNWLMVERLIAEVHGTAMYLELYLYRDEPSIAWQGWVAHVTQDVQGNLTIDTDNDPDTRRALYEALH